MQGSTPRTAPAARHQGHKQEMSTAKATKSPAKALPNQSQQQQAVPVYQPVDLYASTPSARAGQKPAQQLTGSSTSQSTVQGSARRSKMASDHLGRGHVSFAADLTPSMSASSGSSGSSVEIGPIMVTTSPPDSASLGSQSPPESSPLTLRDVGIAGSPVAAGHSHHESPGAQSQPPDATTQQGCDVMLRRMRSCGDEVKKLSMELQTRIDSLLTTCCSNAQVQCSTLAKMEAESNLDSKCFFNPCQPVLYPVQGSIFGPVLTPPSN